MTGACAESPVSRVSALRSPTEFHSEASSEHQGKVVPGLATFKLHANMTVPLTYTPAPSLRPF